MDFKNVPNKMFDAACNIDFLRDLCVLSTKALERRYVAVHRSVSSES